MGKLPEQNRPVLDVQKWLDSLTPEDPPPLILLAKLEQFLIYLDRPSDHRDLKAIAEWRLRQQLK